MQFLFGFFFCLSVLPSFKKKPFFFLNIYTLNMISITTPTSSPSSGVGSFIHSYGSKKFIRPKTDDVLDAVAQARFNEKKWVWIEDDNEGYVRGHVINEEDNTVEVEYENGGVSIFIILKKIIGLLIVSDIDCCRTRFYDKTNESTKI